MSTDQAKPHEEWVAAMKFGMHVFLENPGYLSGLLIEEAQRMVKRDPLTFRARAMADIMQELNLKFAINEPWTLGDSINGHTLKPGQQWHRKDFKEEDLPYPYRPLLIQELDGLFHHDVGWKSTVRCRWQAGHSWCADAKDTDCFYRTTRPLPDHSPDDSKPVEPADDLQKAREQCGKLEDANHALFIELEEWKDRAEQELVQKAHQQITEVVPEHQGYRLRDDDGDLVALFTEDLFERVPNPPAEAVMPKPQTPVKPIDPHSRHRLFLDRYKFRGVYITAPAFVTKAEMERIKGWIETIFIVENS